MIHSIRKVLPLEFNHLAMPFNSPASWDFKPRKLNKEERKDPFNVARELFSLASLPHIQTWPSILQNIKSCIEPVHIYLLGTIEKKNRLTTVFTEANSTVTTGWHYHLLITTNNFEHKNSETIQENIEAKCSAHTLLTCWVIHETDFVKGLAEGTYFYQHTKTKAQILFTQQEPDELLENDITTNGKPDPASFINRAEQFMAAAQLLLLRNQPALAAFQLHQAVEQALTAMVFCKTGFRPPTHNLLRLKIYAQLFHNCPHEPLSFLPAEEQFLQQLQKAYIGSRYSNDFNMKKSAIETLYEKFRKLIQALKTQTTLA